LLSAERLAAQARSAHWAPEIEIRWTDDIAELDLALIIDGRITVGEAKSNNTLKTSDKGTTFAAERLVNAARHLRADQIVLATSKPSWNPAVRPAVDQAITDLWTNGPHPVVVELTGVGAPPS